MAEISDITDKETWVIRTTLRERFKGEDEIELQIADADIRLNPSDQHTSSCPVWYWQWESCHFVIFKTGDRRYRCQFFYRPYQQYSTGIREYSDLTECIVSLLQTQADHAAKEQGNI